MERASTARRRAVTAAAATALLCAAPAGARAQRLLELNPRTNADAEALAHGALAVFWNPAGAALLEGRAEASVIDVRGPESTGLNGLAIAAALRVDPRTVVALGFEHAGIDGIERTGTSPLPEDRRGTIDMGEDAFGAAAARTFGDVVSVGLAVHYLRAADVAQVDDALELGAGAVVHPELPLAPVLALAARVDGDDALWRAGIEVSPFRMAGGAWSMTAGYGTDGGGRATSIGHRVVTGARYRDRARVAIGAVGGGRGEDFGWVPVASAELRIARYVVGVLRETLPNDFGAVHAFRFTVRF
jgi:hypothetical protein